MEGHVHRRRRATKPVAFNSTTNAAQFMILPPSNNRARIEFHFFGATHGQDADIAPTSFAQVQDAFLIGNTQTALTISNANYVLSIQYPFILDYELHGDLVRLGWFGLFVAPIAPVTVLSVIEIMYEDNPTERRHEIVP